MDDFNIFLKTKYGIDKERYELLPSNEKEDIRKNFEFMQKDVWKGLSFPT